MNNVQIQNLTKDYGNQKGIFDVSLSIQEGEVFGFLGPNGAGKTTTIRHLLGFIQPQKGSATILGQDCWKESHLIKRQMGYLPAEIAFPENMTGIQLIHHTANMHQLTDLTRANELIARFEFDPSTSIKRMSKGMKQKVGIVCAFMHDPKILVLDEPTTGLDPLMQSVFIKLIQEEKEKGKSILMSSHIFEEIEGTCDRIAMIKDGKIVSTSNRKEFERPDHIAFKVVFGHPTDFRSIQEQGFTVRKVDSSKNEVIIDIHESQTSALIQALAGRDIVSFREVHDSLENSFMSFYKREESPSHVS